MSQTVQLEITGAHKVILKDAVEASEGVEASKEEGYIEVTFQAPTEVSDPEECICNTFTLCMPLDYTGATVGRKVSIYL